MPPTFLSKTRITPPNLNVFECYLLLQNVKFINTVYKPRLFCVQTETLIQTQGIIHELTLSMFYEKKFNRCPERYFMNSFFLGVYMLAANIMLVNLLVALFATTYEIVQVFTQRPILTRTFLPNLRTEKKNEYFLL